MILYYGGMTHNYLGKMIFFLSDLSHKMLIGVIDMSVLEGRWKSGNLSYLPPSFNSDNTDVELIIEVGRNQPTRGLNEEVLKRRWKDMKKLYNSYTVVW